MFNLLSKNSLFPICLFFFLPLCGWELEELISTALHCNPELQACEAEISASQAQVHAAWGRFFPEIAFEGGSAREDLHARKESYEYGFVGGRWNLWNGGADKIELDTRKQMRNYQCWNLKKKQRLLSVEIAKSFYHLLYFQKAEELCKEAMGRAQTYREIAQRMWNSGLSPQADLLAFDLYLMKLQNRHRTLQSQHKTQQHHLRLLTGESCKSIDFHVSGDFFAPQSLPPSPDLSRLPEVVMENALVCIADKEVQRSWSSFSPQVDLSATYGTEPDSREERRQGGQVYLNVTIPLFEGFSRWHQTKAARCTAQAEKWRRHQLFQELQVHWQELETQTETLGQMLEAHLALSEKNQSYWELMKNEYERGVHESGEMAEAIEAVLDYKLQLLGLQKEYSISFFQAQSLQKITR